MARRNCRLRELAERAASVLDSNPVGAGQIRVTSPGTITDPTPGQATTYDLAWSVVVWDDPVNLMDYVVFVFQTILGVDADEATKLMLEVHNEGRSSVFSGVRERAESIATRMHSHGLWATVSR
jgi:ATP-dependent Clp protease adaptor protein ClpS